MSSAHMEMSDGLVESPSAACSRRRGDRIR